MNLNLLISNKEYSEIKHRTPYCYHYKSENQFLYYFGCDHSYNLDNEIFKELKNFGLAFIDATKNSNRAKAALIESRPVPQSIPNNLSEVVSRYGERGYIVGVARSVGIEEIYPDLNIKEEAILLKKDFSKDIVAYYYFIRNIRAWLKKDPTKKLKVLLKESLETIKADLGRNWPGLDIQTIQKTHQSIFNQKLDMINETIINRSPVPIFQDTIINKVASRSSQIRDTNLLQRIEKEWKAGKSLFVVYGASHAVKQEPVIKEMINH